MKNYNIAIDGPAGAGKSTIAKIVAKKLEYIYVDTGAMYRAMGIYMLNNGISVEDEESVSKACKDVKITIEYIKGEQQVILNGDNVTGTIRTEEAGKLASAVAKYKAVRAKMVELQKSLAASSNVIMDGRDIGSVVLPNADLKIYLTASSGERALRRWKELEEKGIPSDLNEIETDIIKRDQQDMNRKISPLCQAEDAVLLDTSDLTIDEVIDTIISLFQEKCSEDLV
ncbi:(d)CMP kinase [Anaerocolumna sp. AGMB13025]|uniref:(d)CMP kinase n=1 Tax=Anaerocolumna sp. AGMB13025 TaxID=3039116 RepID=UPI00241DAD94|nr:(d)CMP kinase [Anaerocolumna sp. AGMB13025]WFR54843.1 (d)CMP kinase [Anaerocolumna sp. AGMB13025]